MKRTQDCRRGAKELAPPSGTFSGWATLRGPAAGLLTFAGAIAECPAVVRNLVGWATPGRSRQRGSFFLRGPSAVSQPCAKQQTAPVLSAAIRSSGRRAPGKLVRSGGA